jgi:hypothetical protein
MPVISRDTIPVAPLHFPMDSIVSHANSIHHMLGSPSSTSSSDTVPCPFPRRFQINTLLKASESANHFNTAIMSGLDVSRSSQGRGLCGLLDLLLHSLSTLHSQFVFDPLITVLRPCDTCENHGHFPYSFGLNLLLDYRIQCHVLPLHPLVCAFEASYFASRSPSLVVAFIACFHPRPRSASPAVGVLTFHKVSATYCGTVL